LKEGLKFSGAMAPPALAETEHSTMGRLIVANRRGHQVVEWDTVDTEEARRQVIEAERILREARESGCLVSRKVGDQHVIDHQPFDPEAEEYQIVAPIAGG
jgi:hypothetical protein